MNFPDEIYIFTFSFLSNADKFAVAQVCREWRRLAVDHTLWRNPAEPLDVRRAARLSVMGGVPQILNFGEADFDVFFAAHEAFPRWNAKAMFRGVSDLQVIRQDGEALRGLLQWCTPRLKKLTLLACNFELPAPATHDAASYEELAERDPMGLNALTGLRSLTIDLNFEQECPFEANEVTVNYALRLRLPLELLSVAVWWDEMEEHEDWFANVFVVPWAAATLRELELYSVKVNPARLGVPFTDAARFPNLEMLDIMAANEDGLFGPAGAAPPPRLQRLTLDARHKLTRRYPELRSLTARRPSYWFDDGHDADVEPVEADGIHDAFPKIQELELFTTRPEQTEYLTRLLHNSATLRTLIFSGVGPAKDATMYTRIGLKPSYLERGMGRFCGLMLERMVEAA